MFDLPSMEHTFELNKKGKTGKLYQGTFTYRRLSIGDQGRAGVLKTRLNGDLSNVDAEIDRLHDMISWLRYGLVDYPDWWREEGFGEKLYDLNIIEEIYKVISKFEKDWVDGVQKNVKPDTTPSN